MSGTVFLQGENNKSSKEGGLAPSVPREIHDQGRINQRRFLQGGEEHLTQGFQSQDARNKQRGPLKCFFMG